VTDSPHCHGSATLIAQDIRATILRETQLTASAGIADTLPTPGIFASGSVSKKPDISAGVMTNCPSGLFPAEMCRRRI
jgi:nucleotidyltransferase/DNA polymerase involved in DNA repair